MIYDYNIKGLDERHEVEKSFQAHSIMELLTKVETWARKERLRDFEIIKIERVG